MSRKTTIGLVMLVRPSVCLAVCPHVSAQHPLNGLTSNSDAEDIY